MFNLPPKTLVETYKCKPTKKNGGKTSYTKEYPNSVFRWIDYEYETYYDCESYGCDSICRCGTIENAKVQDSFSNKIAFFNAIWESSGDDLEDALAFIYAKNNFDVDDFEVNVTGGYYGQEIDGVTFDLSINIEAFNQCSTNTERLQLVLKDEHNFLTEATEKVEEWEFVQVLKDTVELTNKKTKKEYIEDCLSYFNYPRWDKVQKEESLRLSKLCAPIVLPNGRKYKAIDGNHRFQAAIQSKPCVWYRTPADRNNKQNYLDFGAKSDMIYVIRPKE